MAAVALKPGRECDDRGDLSENFWSWKRVSLNRINVPDLKIY
jgi:hypothetical protein